MQNKKRWGCSIVLLLLIGLIVYKCTRPERMIYRLGNEEVGYYTVEVPQEIVASKDCKAFKEWASNQRSYIYLHQDRCPWRSKPKSPIGEFVMNGVRLNIPRGYLYMDPSKPDGEHKVLYLATNYPEMKPIAAEDWKKINPNEITMELSSEKIECPRKKPYCDMSLRKYKFNTHTLANQMKLYKTELKPFKDKPQQYDLDAYKNTYEHEGKRLEWFDVYVKGSPWEPKYWIEQRSDCISAFNYLNNKILVKYEFHCKFMPKHQEIRSKIINLIEEWGKEK